MTQENIVVRGAREHNLKNVDVSIPRNRLVVITGVSGSGKSSLAFDTIYAEGQRRYVESLSAYARQFLGRLDKPDVDYIEGLSPSISIDQKGVSHNPRSTVGTVTEIYDYLRLLFARVGKPHCYKCGRAVQQQSIQQIVDSITSIPIDSRIQILAPKITRRKGEHKDVFDEARKSGFVRVRVEGETYDLSEDFNLDKKKWHNIEIIVDRLVIGKSSEIDRVSDSVESALKIGNGTILVDVIGGEEMLFSEEFACLNCNISLEELEPRTFSFNNPHGACPKCTGLGYKLTVDPELVIPDDSLSLSEGAIRPWVRARSSSPWLSSTLTSVAKAYDIPTHIPLSQLSQTDIDILLYGSLGKAIEISHETNLGRTYKWNTVFEGVINNLERRYKETKSDYVRSEIERYMAQQPCRGCEGKRLKQEALSVTVSNLSIIDVTKKSVAEAIKWTQHIWKASDKSEDSTTKSHNEQKHVSLSEKEIAIGAQILKEIYTRLQFLENIGLEYLTLDRRASTLSGGEAQRIRLATQIGSGLMGVLYVCDEPSVGLHPLDDHRLIGTLQRLRDLGNTVLIVEHDEAIMRASDHIIDMGPGAGQHGGNIIATGTVNDIMKTSASLTGQYLSRDKQIPLPTKRRPLTNLYISVNGARENNLKNINVNIPLGLLVCVTGVSGSGKSTLIYEVLYKKLAQYFYKSKDKPGICKSVENLDHIDKIINIDQSPIGRTPRSNPATYTSTFTPIRELFSSIPEARARGYTPGRFSFNIKGGRCESCSGDGYNQIEMQFLPNVTVPCEVCNGKRYNREALQILFKGKNIAEILDMTVSEALNFFSNIPRVRSKLQTMSDVGLGYIQLGQPATTLSGGEAQRIKLSSELSKRSTGKTLYILDEPTTGLSFEDCHNLLIVLQRLVESGNTVVLIEHHLDLIKCADWVIDLGPNAGDKGGYIVAEGTPEQISTFENSHTGKFLKTHLQTT